MWWEGGRGSRGGGGIAKWMTRFTGAGSGCREVGGTSIAVRQRRVTGQGGAGGVAGGERVEEGQEALASMQGREAGYRFKRKPAVIYECGFCNCRELLL